MFRFASDQSLLFDTNPREADLAALARIPGVVNLHPAYTSILIVFDPLATTHEAVEAAVVEIPAASATANHNRVTIPIHYDGPDLEAVARFHGISKDRVIELHAGTLYSVAFLGFVPGFAYLSGLPSALHTPRLPAPRMVVPAGSLGIAGEQTGIYPIATPGGWQLIGRTDIELFNAGRTPMSLLQPGDEVVFQSV